MLGKTFQLSYVALFGTISRKKNRTHQVFVQFFLKGIKYNKGSHCHWKSFYCGTTRAECDLQT